MAADLTCDASSLADGTVIRYVERFLGCEQFFLGRTTSSMRHDRSDSMCSRHDESTNLLFNIFKLLGFFMTLLITQRSVIKRGIKSGGI